MQTAETKPQKESKVTKKYKHTLGSFHFFSEKDCIVVDKGTHYTVTIGELISSTTWQ